MFKIGDYVITKEEDRHLVDNCRGEVIDIRPSEGSRFHNILVEIKEDNGDTRLFSSHYLRLSLRSMGVSKSTEQYLNFSK